jgi:hypothetical protein
MITLVSQFLIKFLILSAHCQTALSHMSKWFIASKLALNLDNTNTIKFMINNSPQHVSSGYNDKYIEEPLNARFLGLQNRTHLKWKNNQHMIRKLCGASSVRSMFQTSSNDTKQFALSGSTL